MATTGGTATTKAMGKGSTQFQHLIETEVPPRRLEDWLKKWTGHYKLDANLRVKLRPHTAGSELLELTLVDGQNNKMANIIFAVLQDRHMCNMLSIRDQNTFSEDFRQKRLMTLITLFLIHRYKAISVHYVTPTEDNQFQAEGMHALGLYEEIRTEVGEIIVARVNADCVKELVKPESEELLKLIAKA
jgi:isocitrate lyase